MNDFIGEYFLDLIDDALRANGWEGDGYKVTSLAKVDDGILVYVRTDEGETLTVTVKE